MLGRLRATTLVRSLDQSGWCTEGITGECFLLGIRASCSRQCVFRASSVLEPLLGSKEKPAQAPQRKYPTTESSPDSEKTDVRFYAGGVYGRLESGIEKSTCFSLDLSGLGAWDSDALLLGLGGIRPESFSAFSAGPQSLQLARGLSD